MSGVHFLAMPTEAMFDKRLTLSDLRVLGAIAHHDRKGVNGRGCYATVSTLARMAGCDTRTVKRATEALRLSGYIRTERSEADRRRQLIRVVYDGSTQNGGKAAPDMQGDRGRLGPLSGTESDPKTVIYQSPRGLKQTHKQISGTDETDPEEAAPFLRNDASTMDRNVSRLSGDQQIARYLREVEENARRMSPEDRATHIEALFRLNDAELSYGDKLYHWADRLMQELEYLNDADAFEEAHA